LAPTAAAADAASDCVTQLNSVTSRFNSCTANLNAQKNGWKDCNTTVVGLNMQARPDATDGPANHGQLQHCIDVAPLLSLLLPAQVSALQ
jgi:hypothetical protein